MQQRYPGGGTRCLAMSERLFCKMSERADAPPSWNGTLLPAMTSSFSSPLGDVDVNDHDAEVPAHEGRGRRLALWWLVDSVLSPREYEAELFQRYALAAIYYATSGLRPPPAPPPPRARGGARPTAAIPIVPPTAIVFAFNSSSTSLAAIEAVCNSAAALFSGLFRAAQVLRRQTPNPEMLYSHCWVILQTWTCRSNYCNMPQSPYLLVFCAGQRKNSPWLQCVFIVHTS
jgi:hypothetical protein